MDLSLVSSDTLFSAAAKESYQEHYIFQAVSLIFNFQTRI